MVDYRTPEHADIFDLESLLRNSDDARRMTFNSPLAIKRIRTDRKRKKVRATASRNEKQEEVNSCRIRCKTFCTKYSRPKVIFKTHEAAERYISYENVLHRAESGRLFAFYCESCHGWHISARKKYKGFAS